ncbi:MAG: hypothetical protein ACYC4U_03545 [Pirellulaceae bacterium]
MALNIIKPGMDTREVVTRFQAERQALALMNHRNIAKVFGAGATDSGRPYFAEKSPPSRSPAEVASRRGSRRAVCVAREAGRGSFRSRRTADEVEGYGLDRRDEHVL